MRIMNNSKTLFESFQENLSKLEEASFDKCQATLPLDNYHSMGIIVSDDGDTVQYMYSNGDEVYESQIEYNEDGEPVFKDEEGYEWKISDFLRTDYGPRNECSLNEDKLESVHRLISYDTPIMEVKDGKIKMLCKPEHLTQKTLRHAREFLQQMGLEPLSKQELLKLINEKDLNEDINPAFKDKYKVTINGEEIKPGYKIKDFRGDEHVFLGVTNPGTPFGGQNGKIRVAVDDGEMEYYPSVFNAKLEKIDEGEYIQEQDTVVRVVTSQREDRDYSITDITELNQVSDGDVQPPIDIAGLLVDVDSRLTESYGQNWGQINFQSTRFNTNTNDSNALFELCVGDKTYLMSMLLEENGSVLKVNNTKGQTIFKRKSNDITSLAESYIKQFISKEADEVPECLKHMNEPLHERLDFIKAYIETIKLAPKESKEELRKYIIKEIYGFIAELSDAIKAEEPSDEDKIELPTFDKMVEDVFGKEWVKYIPKENKSEITGVETLKEEKYLKKYCNKTEKWKELEECSKLNENDSFYGTKKEIMDKYPELKDVESYQSYADDDYMAVDFNDDGSIKGLRLASRDNEKLEEDEEVSSEEIEAEVKDENPAEDLDSNSQNEPKNGLETGYATFARKPKNISQLDDKVNYFTDGDASYLVCQKEDLTKEEFDKLKDDFTADNKYCKEFEPLDLENYSYNVIEFRCSDYDYKLLVDPAGHSYCRYVAKIGGNV